MAPFAAVRLGCEAGRARLVLHRLPLCTKKHVVLHMQGGSISRLSDQQLNQRLPFSPLLLVSSCAAAVPSSMRGRTMAVGCVAGGMVSAVRTQMQQHPLQSLGLVDSLEMHVSL